MSSDYYWRDSEPSPHGYWLIRFDLDGVTHYYGTSLEPTTNVNHAVRLPSREAALVRLRTWKEILSQPKHRYLPIARRRSVLDQAEVVEAPRRQFAPQEATRTAATRQGA